MNLKQIWSIGGGKGGVGKTLLSANMAISLARAKAKVIAVDLDLGGANLHTCLGVDHIPHTLSDLFNGKAKSLTDLIIPTSIPNLSIISGAQDMINIANIAHAQKMKLLLKLRELPADYILVDLGAGTTFNTLDFFLSADVGILCILPEPTSVENAYRFVKSAFFRKLKAMEEAFDAKAFIEDIVNRKNELHILNPADLLTKLEELYPDVGIKIRESFSKYEIKFVLNQVRTQADRDLGYGIRNVCKRYFGIRSEYMGALEYDSAVWQSVRKRRPLAVEFPSSPIMSEIQKMVGSLVAEQAERLKQARNQSQAILELENVGNTGE